MRMAAMGIVMMMMMRMMMSMGRLERGLRRAEALLSTTQIQPHRGDHGVAGAFKKSRDIARGAPAPATRAAAR